MYFCTAFWYIVYCMVQLGQFDISLDSLRAENQPLMFDLDDSFFALFDDAEIRKGALKVAIDVQNLTKSASLHIKIDGEITIPCDRCLDDMQQSIEVDDVLTIKLGDQPDEDDESITVTDELQIVNMAWPLYEYIALAIPIMHTHAEGECNAEMMAHFEAHTIDENTKKNEPDPRWDALKNISKNTKDI